MRKLSFWAKRHPTAARIIIVISHLLLSWIALFLGKQAASADLEISPLWLYPLLVLFFIAGIFYPANKSAATYLRRKLCDLTVCTTGFLMLLCLTAQLHKPLPFYTSLQASVPMENPIYRYPEAGKLLEQFKNGEKTTFTRKEKRIIRKEFNHQLLVYAAAKVTGNKEAQSNAAGIIAVCLTAVGLLFLVASLACSLSCNGHEGAAAIVGIGGAALIIFGTVMLIRSLTRKKAQPSHAATD